MLIYRVETCISLIGKDRVVSAGLGPYGTRDVIRHELGRREYTKEQTLIYTKEQTLEKHEIESWIRNNMLFCFSHEECSMKTHPAPTSDMKLMQSFEDKEERPVIRGYTFGFKDLNQLKSWFNENSRIRLHLGGYYVSIYEVAEVHVGDTQCVFRKENAELVSFISCLEV